MVLPLSLALRRKKEAASDRFHTMDDASDVSSGVFSSSPSPVRGGGGGRNPNNGGRWSQPPPQSQQSQQSQQPPSLLDSGGRQQFPPNEDDDPDDEEAVEGKPSPVHAKTTFKQRMASFGRMYGGGGGGAPAGSIPGGGTTSSPKPAKIAASKSPTSVMEGEATVGTPTPASPPRKEASSPRSAKARLLRHLMGHPVKPGGGGRGTTGGGGDDAASVCTAANRRETASTHECETEDDSVVGDGRSPSHKTTKRPTLLNPPSIADLSVVLQATDAEKKTPRLSRRNHQSSSSPPSRPSMLSPPSLADVTTVLTEQDRAKTKSKSRTAEPTIRRSPQNRRHVVARAGEHLSSSHNNLSHKSDEDETEEEADDIEDDEDGGRGNNMDRFLSSSKAKMRRSRSCGSSSVSHARTITPASNRIQTIRGNHSTLAMTLDSPVSNKGRHRDAQSVHPELLRSPRSKTPSRQQPQQQASPPGRTGTGSTKSPHSPTTATQTTAPPPGAPTLDARLSTPLDVPERRSQHGPLRDDDVEAPQHLRRATGTITGRLEPSGRQQRRAVSHSPIPRRPTTPSRHSSSNDVGGKDMSSALSPAPPLDAPERSSRHTVAHDCEFEARASSRRSVAEGIDPVTPGRTQRRAVSHSPSPRHPLTPKTPKTPTLDAGLPLSGSRLLNRTASSASATSPGSVSDPSVERIMKMLQDISPKGGTKSANHSPNSNASEDESEVVHPSVNGGSGTGSAPRSGTTKKRRIKISASLLLSDDDEDPIDPRALIQAVANSPSKQIRGGRVELLKKQMLEEVKAARSRTPKSRRVASAAPSASTKSPSSSKRGVRTMPSLETALASGDDSTSGRRSIERAQSQKSVSDKSVTTTPVKQVRRVHSSRTVTKAPSPRTPPRSHSDGYGPSDHERKARSPSTPSATQVTEPSERGSERKSPRTPTRTASEEKNLADLEASERGSERKAPRTPIRTASGEKILEPAERGSERKSPRTPTRTASGEKNLADPERKTSRSPRTPSRRTSNGSHDSHERSISRSLHKSRSGRRPGSRKNVLEESPEGGAQLETGPTSRRSHRCLENDPDADDEPILVQPVEGRKAMKMLSADMDVDHAGAVFAQLQIPGMDSHHRGMAVQYEDC